MNKCVLLTGLLVVTCVLFTAVPETDWQVYELKGKVKSVVGNTRSMTLNSKGF